MLLTQYLKIGINEIIESIRALLILFLFSFRASRIFFVLNTVIKCNPTKNKKTEDNKTSSLTLFSSILNCKKMIELDNTTK